MITYALAAAVSIASPFAQDATPTKVWVYFADDRPDPCCVEDTALTERAVQRRALRRTLPGLFDKLDVPLSPSLSTAVQSTGATVHTTSRWMHAVSARATPQQAAALR
ncbi:MAG: hypothetical protein JNK53_02835, partial [Phycisphaerae bacterium]|nr:hypothetical protein [Phycisphaerae bacterium]